MTTPRFMRRAGQPAICYKLHEAEGSVAGAVLISTGFSEHTGRYTEVAQAWARAGFVVAVYDLRGQGESEGPRGHVRCFSDYVEDLSALLGELHQHGSWRQAGCPILFGHSLGALIVAHLLLAEPTAARGFACSSPFFALSYPAPRWQQMLARLVTRIWPMYSEATKVGANLLTHDLERARLIDADPLGVRRVTARWFTEVEAAQQQLMQHAEELALPVFCLAAGDDRLASVGTTRQLFEKLPQGALIVLEGRYHELHQEDDRAQHLAAFLERFQAWVR